jgi:hypothetical protein
MVSRTTGDHPHLNRLAARRRVDGVGPERGERRVHRVLEDCHQVRLPLISTRGRVQIGSGLNCTGVLSLSTWPEAPRLVALAK